MQKHVNEMTPHLPLEMPEPAIQPARKLAGRILGVFATVEPEDFATVPVAALGALLGSIFMPEREEDVRSSFDWIGFALLTTSLGCLLTALSNGQREGWHSDFIVGLFAMAGIGVDSQ